MRKFNTVYKEKQGKADELHETRILADFKKIYNALLEHYKLTAIHDLNEKSQISFLTELNTYWTEASGLNEDGMNFLKKRSLKLTESSTPLQKKNYLKVKTSNLLNELMRKTDLKYRVYNILDEMFKNTDSSKIDDVLSPQMITDIIKESFGNTLDELAGTIYTELNESVNHKEVNNKKKVYLKKTKLNEANVDWYELGGIAEESESVDMFRNFALDRGAATNAKAKSHGGWDALYQKAQMYI